MIQYQHIENLLQTRRFLMTLVTYDLIVLIIVKNGHSQ